MLSIAIARILGQNGAQQLGHRLAILLCRTEYKTRAVRDHFRYQAGQVVGIDFGYIIVVLEFYG